ncbi:hypothetical protein LTR94_025056, partial [Friedmanniomyces endolithicus]
TSTNQTLSLTYRPTRWDGFEAGLQYYDFAYEDRIAYPDPQYLSLTDIRNAPEVLLDRRSLTPQEFAELLEGSYSNLFLVGGPNDPSQFTVYSDNRLRNLSTTNLSGLIARASLSRPFYGGDLNLSANLNHMMEYEVQLSEATPTVDRLDSVYFPTSLRSRVTATWSGAEWSVTGAWNHTGSYEDDRLAGTTFDVNAWNTFDMGVQYAPSDDRFGMLRGIRFILSANNVLDAAPPRIRNAAAGTYNTAYDPANASIIGRVISSMMVALAVFVALSQPASGQNWAKDALSVNGAALGGSVSLTDLAQVRRLSAFTLSPDRSQLAFAVYQGVADEDRYAMRWFVQPVDASGPPRPISVDAGQPIPYVAAGVPQAQIIPPTVKWAPDGNRFAFQRLDKGAIALWIADSVSGNARQISEGASDVVLFEWTSDGALIWRAGKDLALFEAAIANEVRNGWLMDHRAWRMGGSQRPTPPDCIYDRVGEPGCDGRAWRWTQHEGVRPASQNELSRLTPEPAMSWIDRVRQPPRDWTRQVWRAQDFVGVKRIGALDTGSRPHLRLHVERDGELIPCRNDLCQGAAFRALGWLNDQTVWFLKGEDSLGRLDGAPFDQASLYLWDVGSAQPRRLTTQAQLEGCELATQARFICMRESYFTPRHLVSISADTGAVQVLADPNPEFASKAHPKVETLRGEDAEGNPGTGYLVYPNDFKEGELYPLVVTQYRQRGFLDAQVGGEYPILPLAANGYFVLSIDQADQNRLSRTYNALQVSQHMYRDANERKRVLEALSGLVDAALETGHIDPERLGITGLSSGAESTHYTLQHSNRFAAAITSSGAYDRSFLAFMPPG